MEAASAQPHLCIFAALKIIVHVKLFPQSADYQLEFDKIREIVHQYCNTEMGRTRATQMRIHTRKEYIDLELSQTNGTIAGYVLPVS